VEVSGTEIRIVGTATLVETELPRGAECPAVCQVYATECEPLSVSGTYTVTFGEADLEVEILGDRVTGPDGQDNPCVRN
jgi:hypothetical protein